MPLTTGKGSACPVLQATFVQQSVLIPSHPMKYTYRIANIRSHRMWKQQTVSCTQPTVNTISKQTHFFNYFLTIFNHFDCFYRSHPVVLYNDKVIYSVKIQHIYNHYYKFGDMFRFTEPSSGQFLIKRSGTFSECADIFQYIG